MVYNITKIRKAVHKMKSLNSLLKFTLLIWIIISCTISAMLTFEPKDSNAYWWAAQHHKGIIAIEVTVSTASDKGTYGLDSDSYYIAYNKRRTPNSKVLSVFLFNPMTNYEDDIILAYDSGMVR